MRLDAKLSIINDTISASLGEFYNLSAEEKKQYEDAIKDLTEQAENSFNNGYNEGFADGLEQGELPEEAFVLSGSCSYRFRGGGWDWFVNQFGDKITTKDITDSNYFFAESKVETIPFELNFKEGVDYHQAESLFNKCVNLKTPPKINGIKPYSCQSAFGGCESIKEFPKDYFDNWDFSYMNSANRSSGGILRECYSLRKAPKFNNVNFKGFYGSSFYDCYVLDEVLDFPVISKTLDSNAFNGSFTDCNRLKNLTFRTNEDGTPIVVEWQKQSLGLYGSLGWADSTGNITKYGITLDKAVYTDEKYEALKNDDDWFTTNALYSRYNHDSAVNTINSLPDTLAYVTEKGSTNTITFKGDAGSKTDGGAINTLTEEEIAVATAKGWTVSFK